MSSPLYEGPHVRPEAEDTTWKAQALMPSGANATSGGRTDWSSMSIADILAKILGMTDSSASGDANAIKAALAAVEKVVQSLTATFGDDPMRGLAADGSRTAGAGVGRDIAAAAESVRPAIDALEQAQAVLTNTSQQRGVVSGIAVQMRARPEDAAQLRSRVASLMESVYTTPMVDVQTWLPELPGAASDSPGAGDAGQSVIPSMGGRSGRTQAGGISESDQGGWPSGPSSAESATPGSTPTTSTRGTAGQAPVGSRGGSAPTSGDAAGSGAEGLTRGGLGTADATGLRRTVGSDRDGTSSRHAADGTESGRSGSVVAGEAIDHGSSAGAEDGSGGGGNPVNSATPPWGATVLPGAGTGPSAPGTSATPASAPAVRPGPHTGIPPTTGAGARDRGDNKHQSARYLNTREHGEEIVGDLPLVGPPVIGDWSPQSMPPRDPGSDTSAAEPNVGAVRADGRSDADRSHAERSDPKDKTRGDGR